MKKLLIAAAFSLAVPTAFAGTALARDPAETAETNRETERLQNEQLVELAAGRAPIVRVTYAPVPYTVRFAPVTYTPVTYTPVNVIVIDPAEHADKSTDWWTDYLNELERARVAPPAAATYEL